MSRHAIRIGVFGLAMACLLLGGCFSMSAVPPAPGLQPLHAPQEHASVTLDPDADTMVESDWGNKGRFVLVHPLVNGRDVGWFILDSGASGCTITGDAAHSAGLEAIGAARLQGEALTTVFRCESLRLGALTLAGLNMTGLNMSRSSNAFGRRIAGILGRNVFAGTLVELDGPGRRVRLLSPDANEPASGEVRHAIEQHHGLDYVRCRYAGGAPGLFVLDTGADACVHFFEQADTKTGIRSAPGTRITGHKTQVTFGSTGRIDTGFVAPFAIGEQPFGEVEASFAGEGDGPSKRLPDADGMIGMGLIQQHIVRINEARGWVSFMANPGEIAR